jgi:hypothetical protein
LLLLLPPSSAMVVMSCERRMGELGCGVSDIAMIAGCCCCYGCGDSESGDAGDAGLVLWY